MTLMSRIHRPVLRRANDLDQMFEGFFRPMGWSEDDVRTDLALALDVTEREHDYVVYAEMPGVKKDDVNVTVENGVLTIEGESKSETVQKEGDRVLRQERRFGRYVRSLRLGKEVNEKAVKAAYKDGVLELTLPKAEEAKPRKIAVDIN